MAATVMAATMISVLGVVPAGADEGHLKLFAAKSEITVTRRGDRPAYLDAGVFMASIGGDFEIHVTRPNYATEIRASQWAGGDWVRDLDPSMVDGWRGLADFVHVRVKGPGGRILVDRDVGVCPGGYDIQRVDDSGPSIPRLPQFGCYAMPFTLGTVWGIDEGWAASVTSRYGSGQPIWIDGRDGTYSVRYSFPRAVADTFGIDAHDASVGVSVTLQSTDGRIAAPTGEPGSSAEAPSPTPTVPTDPAPDPSTVPDLIPLPAFGMQTNHDRHDGRDYLAFGANVWNAGPSPLVVEGFRRPNSDVMDVFQYFYDGDTPVSRSPAGTMLYDPRRGHHHWHFQQFARYSLLDAGRAEVVRSQKEAFCLAPTDAIDITRPGAEWNPYSVGLHTACGGGDAIWIRETLDAGWGDTYFQFVAGQSFDITELPNGRYFVEVRANPTGELIEDSTDNNVSVRRVILRGKPGHRVAVVPPYRLVDSESCWYCYRYHA